MKKATVQSKTTTTAKKTTTTAAPKKASTTAAPKKATTSTATKKATTTTQPTAKKQEEQKQQEPKLAFSKTVGFKGLLDAYQQTYEAGKIPFLIDAQVKNTPVFFKYKGMLLDFEHFGMQEQVKAKTQDDIVEIVRAQLVGSMKVGHDLAIYNTKHINYQEYFGKTQWWDQDIIFTKEKLFQEEYYLKKLLKEEENTDMYGDKGNYMPKEEFKLGFIYVPGENAEGEMEQMEKDEGAYLENIVKQTGLNPKYINFIKIVQ